MNETPSRAENRFRLVDKNKWQRPLTPTSAGLSEDLELPLLFPNHIFTHSAP